MDNTIHTHITRRFFLRGIGLLSATAALAACAKQPDADTAVDNPTPLLAIIHTNDTHGHDVEVPSAEDVEGNFSMAAIPALKAEWEAKGYEVLIVDAGDATQGMPLVDTSLGQSAIAFMNSCEYELMTLGNHEFDWGVENLEANRKQASFPMLSANILSKESQEPAFDTNKICELSDGTKIGFFGLTTPSTMSSTSPKNVESFSFLQGDELYACAQAQVDQLRDKGCELVVCVGHLGNGQVEQPNTSTDVLENVTGIDLFIDGHDHLEVEEEVAGILLVETGCYLHNIGVVAIEDGAPTSSTAAYGTFEGIDTATQAIIDEENARVEKEMNVVLGETPFLLNGERVPGVRTEETNLGDFMADAFRWTASVELGSDVDASVVNGGAIRDSIPEGDITLKSIKAVAPFSNELAVLNVSGAQLLEALEAACQGVGEEEALGAFPQVSGITYTIDATTPYEAGPNYPDSTFASPASPGSRVKITDVGGKGFDESESYSIAASSFLCAGGDTYYAFKKAVDAEPPVTFGFDYEALASYLVEGCKYTVPEEYAEPQGRITIIGVDE